jgi:hypothetical protein
MPCFRVQWLGGGLGQVHVHAALHDRCGDHEDDEQHEGHVHQRGDVTLGVERHVIVAAEPAQGAHVRPSPRVPIVPISVGREAFQLPGQHTHLVDVQVVRDDGGIAAARPATVAISASATPGATALMLPSPSTRCR